MEFEQFSKRWNLSNSAKDGILNTLHHHPDTLRGNVHAEKAVQAVKFVYEKSSDILLVVLPLENHTHC